MPLVDLGRTCTSGLEKPLKYNGDLIFLKPKDNQFVIILIEAEHPKETYHVGFNQNPYDDSAWL